MLDLLTGRHTEYNAPVSVNKRWKDIKNNQVKTEVIVKKSNLASITNGVYVMEKYMQSKCQDSRINLAMQIKRLLPAWYTNGQVERCFNFTKVIVTGKLIKNSKAYKENRSNSLSNFSFWSFRWRIKEMDRQKKFAINPTYFQNSKFPKISLLLL